MHCACIRRIRILNQINLANEWINEGNSDQCWKCNLSKQKIFVSRTAVFPPAIWHFTRHVQGFESLPSLSTNSICPLHTRHNGIKAWCFSQTAGLWVDKLTVTLLRFQHAVTLCFMKNNSFEKWLGAWQRLLHEHKPQKDPNSFSLLLNHWAPSKQLQFVMVFFSQIAGACH